MSVYYNDNDPYCVQWLRNLIAAGHLPDGEVDDRPIQSVSSGDVRRFGQCHFFAGIGGWPLALRLAGWGDRPAWTGSCPCQPWSEAGRQGKHSDARHLWPSWLELIRIGQPAIVFGEQVAGSPEWLRIVRGDLEEMDYAVGAMPIEAASVGRHHLRDRFFFVADANRNGWQRFGQCDTLSAGAKRRPSLGEGQGYSCGDASTWIADPFGKKYRLPRVAEFLVDGVHNGVAACRAIGNAIVPQVAAEFVSAFMECRP